MWKKGQSGNPTGRPKGAKNKATMIREALETNTMKELQRRYPKLLKKAIDMAEEGNEKMLKLFLERIIPVAHVDKDEKGRGVNSINIVVNPIENNNGNVIDAEVVESDDDES